LKECGGLLVSVRETANGAATIDCAALEGGNHRPPQQCLALSPGGMERWQPLPAANDKIAAGEHFVIPGDSHAEETLRQFQQMLNCLPPDQRANILATIGTPALEVRLAMLERTVYSASGDASAAKSSPAATSVMDQQGPAPDRGQGWLARVIQVLITVLISLLAFGAINWLRSSPLEGTFAGCAAIVPGLPILDSLTASLR
jgi:hypothetical protein